MKMYPEFISIAIFYSLEGYRMKVKKKNPKLCVIRSDYLFVGIQNCKQTRLERAVKTCVIQYQTLYNITIN